jgi:CRP-like cAMP-binding protein
MVPPAFNRLLAALEARDLNRMAHDLREETLAVRAVLFDRGELVDRVHFPHTAIIAQQLTDERGRATAAVMIGCNGLAGLGSCLSGGRSLTRQVVLAAGTSFSLDRASFLNAMDYSKRLRDIITSYADAAISETMQNAACMARHTVEERLARFLLDCVDGEHGEKIQIAEDIFAVVLGIEPRQLVLAARRLRSLGALHYQDGTYVVPDRAELRSLACECYAVVRAKYQGIVTPGQASA